MQLPSHRSRRWLATTLALWIVVALLALAGCGSRDEQEATPPPVTIIRASEAQTPEPTTAPARPASPQPGAAQPTPAPGTQNTPAPPAQSAPTMAYPVPTMVPSTPVPYPTR